MGLEVGEQVEAGAGLGASEPRSDEAPRGVTTEEGEDPANVREVALHRLRRDKRRHRCVLH
ncbi:MAG: hypothetical protein ACK559_30245, partial [bacterium]